MLTFSSTVPCAAATKTEEKSILSHNSRDRDQCISHGRERVTVTNQNTDSYHTSDTDQERYTSWNYGMNVLIRFYREVFHMHLHFMCGTYSDFITASPVLFVYTHIYTFIIAIILI